MNFLFHRHLATRDSGSGIAGFGAMLPDLWRMADRRLRPRPLERPEAPSRLPRVGERASEQDKVAALLWGIEHHLALDGLFHRHPMLGEGETLATRLLKEAEIQGDKVLLFGHVAWEICLDGALLRRQGLAATKAGLRAELAAIGPDVLSAALRRHLPTAEADTGERADARVLGLLHQLAWGEWIDGYLNGAGIADRLEGIRYRLRLPPLETAERKKSAAALDQLLLAAEARLDEALALTPLAG